MENVSWIPFKFTKLNFRINIRYFTIREIKCPLKLNPPKKFEKKKIVI